MSWLVKSWPSTGSLLRRRAGLKRMAQPEEGSDEAIPRTLSGLDLLYLGVGGVLGAGIFVTTGQVAITAGPGVVLCYILAGISAILSALIYAEFAVELKVAGGGFSYCMFVFGEFIGWFCVTNLVLSYCLSASAVARGFSSYFAQLIGQPASFFRFGSIDILAFVLVLLLTVQLSMSTKGSSMFNMVVKTINILLILAVIVGGFMNADMSNWSDFLPNGIEAVFAGTGTTYFSYVGWDAVAALAEDAKNPVKDVPIGLGGCLLVVMVLYVLAASAITLMVPYASIDPDAPFTAAFAAVGWTPMVYVVAAGAVCGTVTGSLGCLLGQTRIMMTQAREHLAPRIFAKISPRFGTPLYSTVTAGIVAAVIALFTDFGILADVASIAPLAVFQLTAMAQLHLRYHDKDTNAWRSRSTLLIGTISASCIAFTIVYYALGLSSTIGIVLLLLFLVMWAASTLMLQLTVKQVWAPASFATPLVPWVPAASLLLNWFILGGFTGAGVVSYLIFMVVVIIGYAVYGVHEAAHGEDQDSFAKLDADEDLEGVELVKGMDDSGGSSSGKGDQYGAGGADVLLVK